MKPTMLVVTFLVFVCSLVAPVSQIAMAQGKAPAWEAENPLTPVPEPPLGLRSWDDVGMAKPKPESVRLGRWLFFDKRLSADGTVSCASCHRPEHAFSEPTPVSTGVKGQKGNRKAPVAINHYWAIEYPEPTADGGTNLVRYLFWDGRAHSLEEQAIGPIANPIEMGNTHEVMIQSLKGIKGYQKYFKEAFGSEGITLDRVASAIADFERTLMSGNSAWDKSEAGDEQALSAAAKHGLELFNGKALCNTCHLNQSLTDGRFHNLGVGWDHKAQKFLDDGRFAVSKKESDRGAFKTPGLRDVSKHAPYMHDGSMKTLREVVEHYNKGGNPNPHLDEKMKPLNLTDAEMEALVKFMEALDGEGYQIKVPTKFPE